MESLGGDQYWVDRFLAQHAAVFYYWTVVGFFAISPSNAYTFSELVEARALAPRRVSSRGRPQQSVVVEGCVVACRLCCSGARTRSWWQCHQAAIKQVPCRDHYCRGAVHACSGLLLRNTAAAEVQPVFCSHKSVWRRPA